MRHYTVTNTEERHNKSQFCSKATGWRKLHCNKIQCHIGKLECSNTAPESAGAREGWKIPKRVKAENAPSGIESLTHAVLSSRVKSKVYLSLYTVVYYYWLQCGLRNRHRDKYTWSMWSCTVRKNRSLAEEQTQPLGQIDISILQLKMVRHGEIHVSLWTLSLSRKSHQLILQMKLLSH